jgi:uncharacterized DUF497 family protein
MYIVHMKELRFEWDGKKNRANIKKHDISFEEAQSTFKDEHAIQFFDPDHSTSEDRFILLGISSTLRVVIVCHCFREDALVVRIISARKADQSEEKDYWGARQ